MPRTAATARRPDHPPWVLLDTAARIGRCENATTATAKTSAGDDIAVSFSATRPPGLSSCFVHCPGLPAEASAWHPQVTGADGALLLITVRFAERNGRGMFTDVFAYRAGGPGEEPPSLHLLPRPYPVRLHYDHVGVLSRGGHHLVVAPQPQFEACGRMYYDLHVFSTETMSWSTTVAPVAAYGDTDYDLLVRHVPTKVISIGGVGLGWVDLRRGVLLCNDVADERPEVRLVQLPSLLRTNRADFGEGFDGATPSLRQIRDVTCGDDGVLRFVEIEYPDLDEDNLTAFRWTATMFTRGICAENWDRHHTVDSAELSPADACSHDLFPEEIWDCEAKKLTLDKVISTAPTLDLHDEDVVYMIAKLDVDDPNGLAVLAVNTRNKTLVGVAPFAAGSSFFYLHPTYQQCSFTKYLSKDQLLLPD